MGRNEGGLKLFPDAGGFLTVNHWLSLAADDMIVELRSSADLVNWSNYFEVVSRQPTHEGKVSISSRSSKPAGSRRFVRIFVRTR